MLVWKNDLEAIAAQFLLDGALAGQHLLFLARGHTGAAVIQLAHHAGYLGKRLLQALRHVGQHLPGLPALAGGGEHHHGLTGVLALAQGEEAVEAVMPLLIVGLQSGSAGFAQHPCHDVVGTFREQMAMLQLEDVAEVTGGMEPQA